MSRRTSAFLAAVAMLLASGALHYTLGRDSEGMDEALTRVPLVPLIIGDWNGQEETADTEAFAQAGAKAYWTRVYVNEKTKTSVLAILMCGRPGKMAIHTPEVCYGGAGFELHDTPALRDFKDPASGSSSQFWTAHFTKNANGGMKHLRLYWGWNARGDWEASSSPRWHFRGEPFLYKLYVSRDADQAPTGGAPADPAADFVRDILPTLNATLFPRGESGSQP